MICYRNRAFCSSDCTNSACDRFVSEEVERKGLKWTQTFIADANYALLALTDFSSKCAEYAPETSHVS